MPNHQNRDQTQNQNQQNRGVSQMRDHGSTMSHADTGSSMQRGGTDYQARDSQGRFTDDQPRDAQGRFMDDASNTNAAHAARSGDDTRQRDAQGRFKDEDGSSTRKH